MCLADFSWLGMLGLRQIGERYRGTMFYSGEWWLVPVLSECCRSLQEELLQEDGSPARQQQSLQRMV